MSFIPIILGLVMALCLSSSDLLSRGSSRVRGPYATATNQLLVGAIILAVFWAAVSPGVSLAPFPVALMVSAAMMNFASVALLYKGLHKGVVSVVAPIVYSYPSVTLVFSVFLLGVRITILEAAALAGIIGGVILASARFSELRTKPTVSGVYPAVFAAFLGGLSYLALGASVPMVGPVLPVFFLRAFGALTGFVIAPVAGQKIRVTRDTFSPRIIAIASLAAAAFLAYGAAVNLDPNSLPIVAAVGGIGGAFEAAYAVIFIRERLELNQVAGILLLVACVSVLLYLSR
jgi:drug/metabolite transporter (DMT)-like permease